MANKTVIVGGVAGGATAAARLRRLDENAEIVMLERGEYISFANCGLPYHIGGVIEERENLLVQTVEGMSARFNLDIRIKHEALKINRAKKEILVKDLLTGNEYIEKYDKLVLSPGAHPFVPNIPGIKSERVFTLRNIPDTDRIKNFIDTHKVKRAIIIGAGYIGLEMAENLHDRGIAVTIVELGEQVISPVDYEMAALVHEHLKMKNIEFYLRDTIKSLSEEEGALSVRLESNKIIKADMIILSIGVKPETKLAVDAGLEIGITGGIKIDKYTKTSDPDIFAVGDAVEATDFVTRKPALIPLAGPANKMGRVAADNICGKESTYDATLATSIVKIFDLTLATTGASEKLLKKHGIPYLKSYTHSGSHAGYYPGAFPIAIKIIFSPETGRILGAQAIGVEGVDKRIDVLASAIKFGKTTFELEEFEHCYAPPFSSAKDPVNIACYVASNMIKGEHDVVHWDQIGKLEANNTVFLDVRDEIEVELGKIQGSINIPLPVLRENLDKLPKDKLIVVYCQIGLRGYVAYRILKGRGFENVVNLSGGFKLYYLTTLKQSNEGIFEYDKVLPSDEIRSVKPASMDFKIEDVIKVNACGLQCPGPIMKLYKSIEELENGGAIEVSATDPGFYKDVKAWCERTGNSLLDISQDKGVIKATVQKGTGLKPSSSGGGGTGNDKTMVVFSNDLDKAIASFIIANGAASMGRKVTMFFTFWGLSVLRRPKKVKVKKSLIGRMFGKMLPRGSKKLKLSKMNMMGIGKAMIEGLMKKKNISSVTELIASAVENGIKLVACQMTMDLMGIKEEELIDGVEIGGVATFLAAGETSDMNLFI
jgi:NADPH-dependent 2,4-dienoyl-CoA reductase/sulfur reductase-like enzyme/peroxiredoxin family protein/rhodanese-related sulfurtransferase/TusA-related sulfurtransferase